MPRDSSSPLFLHRFLSALTVAMVALVPEGMHDSRGLSLSVSFHHVEKETSCVTKSGDFLK